MKPHIVLLADDDRDARDDLAVLIERQGRRVVTAANGQEALQRIGEVGRPCLIILDLMMPVMDGWTLYTTLRRDPAVADVPVILLSGIPEIDQVAASLNAVGYLRKPVDLGKLYELIQMHC